jgi:hypothetical protein
MYAECFFPLQLESVEGKKMSVDERSRLQLAEAAKRVFGADKESP